jgi:hypothetical protein
MGQLIHGSVAPWATHVHGLKCEPSLALCQQNGRLPPFAAGGDGEIGFSVSTGMKKCPNCYAFMKETTQVPKLRQKPPKVSGVKVRYECPQCGHMEEAVATGARRL